jgi:hypothetical protein
MTHPRLTILIPLHCSQEWLENICQNIQRCPSDCRIIISDVTMRDDTIVQLEKRHADDSRIVFRKRESDLEWRQHLNELFELVETEFFSILPHDDYTSDDYYPQLIAALDQDQNVGLAFGSIWRTYTHGGAPKKFLRPPFKLRRRSPWRDAIDLDQRWNLGIPWRGVIRSTYLWPTPINPYGYSDQLWVFGIALQTYLEEVPSAVYYKRYHENNTHSAWEPLKGKKRMKLLRGIIKSRLKADRVARTRALLHLFASNLNLNFRKIRIRKRDRT